jgi:hypothetical protein
MSARRFSVIINTDNRAKSLALTLEALRHLDHPSFEVIVVRGPTPDATDEVLRSYTGAVKVGHCPALNLSQSRNIGVAMASGEIVAFIDDDAYPDPQWLNRLDEAYDDPEIVGAGGPVWDWSGARLQVLYSLSDRLGQVWIQNEFGADLSFLLARPDTSVFTYPIGTNSSFLRHRVIEIGGFDEQFEYGWDEVDLCHRFIEKGWVVRVIEDGFVYHKSLPSAIRGENRATHNMRVLLKNKAYYTYKHGWGVVPLSEIAASLTEYAQHYRDEIARNVEKRLLTEADLEQYERDVAAGFDIGYAAWREGGDLRRPPAWFADREQPFVAFPTLRARADKLHLVFFSVEYPPEPLNGIGRVVHGLATGLGRRGHEVHVLTRGAELDRVDFEDGVWVHRMVPRPHIRPEGISVSEGLWNYAATLRDEALRIDRHRPLDLVQAPNWSTEGIAVLIDGRLPLVVGLYTPLATVAAVDTPLSAAMAAGDPEVPTLLELERFTYRHAPYFLACGPSVVEEIESAYGVTLRPERVGLVPQGIEDRSGTVHAVRWPGHVEVLFVGRLEDRKGIDTLLATIPDIVRAHPEVGYTIIGDDTRPMTDGRTHRQRFEASPEWSEVSANVRFLGRVDDDELYRRYAGCDIFVAPSRFESFGLILLEAMMFAKPVVASDVGGMAEIVCDGENGFLVPAGDVGALREAITALVVSRERREEFGLQSRRRFERLYRNEAMVDGVNRYFDSILGRTTADPPSRPPEPPSRVGPAPARPADRSEPPPPAAAPTPRVAPLAPGLSGPPPELAERLRCPHCGSAVSVVAFTVTEAGEVKTGRLHCSGCDRVVGTVEHFKYDFLADPAPGPVPEYPLVVPELGERRIAADGAEVERQGAWAPDGTGSLVSPGVIGDALVVQAECTDVIVRMRALPTGGIVDISIDGVPTTSVDLYQREGSENLAVRVAADLPLARREVAVRARGQGHPDAIGKTVLVEEVVLYGPLGTDTGFGPPQPINRGNPYSPYLERWLATIPDGLPVLEFGGGDRRLCRPGHLNLEYLRFELADGYADIHAIPFADDTFAATWSQAVFEHIDDPFRAAEELIRVTRPGGLVMTEVAFMQPLHAVPYHFFNMTTWGVQALFANCEILECDWFGDLSTTIEWLTHAVNLHAKVDPAELAAIIEKFRSYDALVSHAELRAAASAVYLVARKPG